MSCLMIASKLVANKLQLHRKDVLFGFQICVICSLWWTSSSVLSIVNKLTLQRYPFPLTIALSSCLNNVLYSLPLIRFLSIPSVAVPTDYLLRTVVPISIGRAVAVTSAYFALWKISVSYSQTVKSTMPLFTVLISRLLLGERQPIRIYLSLMPIVTGVFIATATEIQFDAVGLCSSLLSTGIFAFLNVLAKKVFDETGMHPINLLSLNSQLASLMLFPFWLLTDAAKMWSNIQATNIGRHNQPPDPRFLFLLLLSGVCSFTQSACAFVLIHRLSTLSYSVTNTAKRVFVIALSLLTLRNPVTPLNICGMLLSVFGVFCYNRVRVKGKRNDARRHPTPPLPNSNGDQQQFRRQPDTSSIIAQQFHSSNSDVRLLLANE
uniref:Sugar phosphate transporter domain-containing protein n=1 Tax=Globodera rostochiensis TaxID=31243 RepID=A0A914GVV8_GLORO